MIGDYTMVEEIDADDLKGNERPEGADSASPATPDKPVAETAEVPEEEKSKVASQTARAVMNVSLICPSCGNNLADTADRQPFLICRIKDCELKGVVYKKPMATLEIVPQKAPAIGPNFI